MSKVSLIIPCYNEEKNIKPLFSEISKLQKKIKLEVIIVDNGSKDRTLKEIFLYKKKVNNLKIVKIKMNKGFGHGVKAGIKKSSSNLICYTHADLQINLNSVLKAYKIFKLIKKKNFLIKGKRSNRSFQENFFTFAMSLFNSLLFRKILWDIHAQPNLFNKSIIKNINFLPNNMLLDLYVLLCAKNKNYEVFRVNVRFLDRKFGEGSNDSLVKKIKYSLLSIFSSLRLLVNGKF